MKSGRKFFAVIGIVALCLALCAVFSPGEARAAAGPMGDVREAYVKDSILSFFIPADEGSTAMRTRVISFDVKAPGANVGHNDARIVTSTPDFLFHNAANVTGTPAALGNIRGDDGKLTYAIADYGSSGRYIWTGKVDLAGNVEAPSSVSLPDISGGYSFSRATDLLMYDVNGDGYEDFIIAEIFYMGDETSDAKQKVINIIDGKDIMDGSTSPKSQRYTVIATTYARTPYMKLGLADFTGDGKKQLVAAYSEFTHDNDSSNHKGNYYYDVYDINPATFVLTTARTKQLIGPTDRRQDVLALAVGRFTGKGRDEVMVLSNKNAGSQGVVGDNEYRRSIIYFDNNAWGYKDYITDPGGGRNDYDGGFAAAFDLDGCGRDEFIWAAPSSSQFYVMGVMKVDDNYNISYAVDPFTESVDMMDYSLAKVMNMTAGSFSGRTIAGAGGLAAGEVVVFRRWPTRASPAFTVYDPVLTNGRISGLSKRHGDERNFDVPGGPHQPVLATGNIFGESLRFAPEEPEIIDMGEEMLITSVIPMPPKHVDYIPIPYDMESGEWILPEGQNKDILYGTMYDDFYTSLAKSQTSTNAITSTLKTSGGYTVGFHANVNTMVQLDFAANFANDFMSKNTAIDTTSRGLSMTDQSKFRDNVSYTRIARQIWRYKVVGERVTDPETGAWEEVYYEFETPMETFETGTASDNLGGDFAEIYAPIHERYNVLSYPSDVASTLDFPIEPERILSPVMTVEDVATAANKKWDITWGESFAEENAESMSINADVTASIGVAIGSSATTEKGIKGLIQKAASINRQNAKAILEGKFGGKYSWETGSVTSSKWDESVIVSTFANTERQARHPTRLNYAVEQQIFKLPNGAVSVANAVRLPNDTGRPVTIWDNPNSVYMLKPDLALNLPFKFQIEGVNMMNEYLGVEPVAESLDALAMRGLRILNKSGSPYAGADSLMIPTDEDIEGTKIRFPVHNYSTGELAPNFEVRVLLVPIEETRFLQMPDWTGPNKGPEPVYDKTFIVDVDGGIPFHQQGKNNWIWVEHTFGNEIKNLPQGEYRLFIELDPNNQIDETHKKWDYRVENLDPNTSSVKPYADNPGGDPGGNNIGYVKVALYNYFDEEGDALANPANRTANAEPAALRVNIADNGRRPMLAGMAVGRGLAGGVTIPYDLEVWYDDPNAPDFVPGFRVAVIMVSDEGGSERMIAYKALPGLTKDRRYRIEAKLGDDAFRFIEEAGQGEIRARVIGSHDFEIQLPEPVRFSYDGAMEAPDDGGKIGINVRLTEYPDLSPETIMNALAGGEEIPFEAEVWYDDEDAPDSIPGFRFIVYVEPEAGGQYILAEKETGELAKGTTYRYDAQLTGNLISNLIAAQRGTIKWQVLDSEYEVTLLIPEEIPFDMDAVGLGCETGTFASPALLILAAMAILRKKLRRHFYSNLT